MTSASESPATLHQLVGGDQFFTDLVDHFYDGLEDDEVLADFYPADPTDSRYACARLTDLRHSTHENCLLSPRRSRIKQARSPCGAGEKKVKEESAFPFAEIRRAIAEELRGEPIFQRRCPEPVKRAAKLIRERLFNWAA